MVAERVEEEMPSISGFEFWGATVVPGKTVKCEVTGNILHITSIAMDEHVANDPKQRSVLSVIVDGKQFVLASLREGVCEQIAVDFLFRENKPVKFKVSGKTTLHLVGYLQPLDLGFDDEEIDSDDEDDEEMSEDEELECEEISDDSDDEMQAAEDAGGKKRPADVAVESNESKASKKSKKANASKPESKSNSAPSAQKTPESEVAAPMVVEADATQPEKEEESQKPQAESKMESEPKSKKEKKESAKKDAESRPEPVSKPKKDESSKAVKESEPKQQEKTEKTADCNAFRKLAGGIMVKDSHIGEGKVASKGKRLGVMYKGMLKNGKVFDSNMDSSKPFFFKMGHGDVIKGWDIGFEGMKVGGKRMIICPPKMAYGKEGAPPEIPPNSVLVFEVELVNVK